MNQLSSVEDRAYAAYRVVVGDDDGSKPCVRCGLAIPHGFRGFVQIMATAATHEAFLRIKQQPEDVFAGSKCLCVGCFDDLLGFLARKPAEEPRRLALGEIEKLVPEERRIESR